MKTIKIQTTGLSLLEVRAKYPDCFYKQTWYDKEAFAQEKPDAGLYEFDFTSKHPGNTYSEHAEILKRKGMEFPHPAVLAEALCIHFKETGERLLPDWYSRTSVLDSVGYRVSVGLFDDEGLYVGDYWDDGRDSRLGVATSRKLNSGTADPESLETLSARVAALEKWQKAVQRVEQ